MREIPHERSSGNVFVDFGLAPAKAAELTIKSALIATIGDTMNERKLTQRAVAWNV
jgi:predicted XRE-type DNA-binding protein